MVDNLQQLGERVFGKPGAIAWNGNRKMALIGHWQDIAAYYVDETGDVWSYHNSGRRFVACGDVKTFRERFAAGRLPWRIVSGLIVSTLFEEF